MNSGLFFSYVKKSEIKQSFVDKKVLKLEWCVVLIKYWIGDEKKNWGFYLVYFL